MTLEFSKQQNDAITYFTYSRISRQCELFSKIFEKAFSSNSCFDGCEVWAKFVRAFSRYFEMKLLWLEIQLKLDNLI